MPHGDRVIFPDVGQSIQDFSLFDEPEKNYITRIFFFTGAHKEGLYTDSFKNTLLQIGARESEEYLQTLFASALCSDRIDNALSVDINSYLSEDLMVKVDIASMAAHSFKPKLFCFLTSM